MRAVLLGLLLLAACASDPPPPEPAAAPAPAPEATEPAVISMKGEGAKARPRSRGGAAADPQAVAEIEARMKGERRAADDFTPLGAPAAAPGQLERALPFDGKAVGGFTIHDIRTADYAFGRKDQYLLDVVFDVAPRPGWTRCEVFLDVRLEGGGTCKTSVVVRPGEVRDGKKNVAMTFAIQTAFNGHLPASLAITSVDVE